MVIGIGCDIVDHAITAELNWETDRNTLNRVFSKQELILYESQKGIKFLSGRFAAKEAILKCLGTAMQDGISLTDIEILRLESGQGNIKLTGNVKKISESKGINSWHISISHSSTSSTAFVIAQNVP